MNYRTLFDLETPDTPIARASDPETSHEAAARIESARSETQQRCLEALRQSSVPLCANQLANKCCDIYGCEGTSEQKRKIWDNYRKRANEIFRKSELTEAAGKQYGSMTFRAKGQA